MSTSSVTLEPRRPWRLQVRQHVRLVAIALGLALLGRTVIAESRWIPSESMLPTLLVGDRLVIDKVGPLVALPPRGAIVVCRSPWFHDPPTWLQRAGLVDDGALVKRVIGLPGETVAVVSGRVRINGRELAEPYASRCREDMPARPVPAGQLWLMGDNRNHAVDSRVFGPVPVDRLIGRAVWRFWPPGRMGRP